MTEISSERPGSLVGAAIPNLVLNEEFQVADAAAARFSAAVLDEQVPHLRAFSWPTDAETLDAFVQFARTTARVDIGHRIFVDLSELLGSSCLAYVRLQHGHLWACAAGYELETVEAARGALLTAFRAS